MKTNEILFGIKLNRLKLKGINLIPVDKYKFGMIEDIFQILTQFTDNNIIFEAKMNTLDFPSLSIKRGGEELVNDDDAFTGYFTVQNVNWYINIINKLINDDNSISVNKDDFKTLITIALDEGSFLYNGYESEDGGVGYILSNKWNKCTSSGYTPTNTIENFPTDIKDNINILLLKHECICINDWRGSKSITGTTREKALGHIFEYYIEQILPTLDSNVSCVDSLRELNIVVD